MRMYTYRPLPDGIDRGWTGTLQVFKYLRSRPRERTRLQEEISWIYPGESYSIKIWHERSPGILQLSTVDTAEDFLRRINTCIRHELARQEDYHRRDAVPPSLPDTQWARRSLLYPRFRPPVIRLTHLPTIPPGFKLPPEEVSIPTTAQCRSQNTHRLTGRS